MELDRVLRMEFARTELDGIELDRLFRMELVRTLGGSWLGWSWIGC